MTADQPKQSSSWRVRVWFNGGRVTLIVGAVELDVDDLKVAEVEEDSAG
jgi:hypothetical protein